jgi:hypothetical protein
MRSVDRPLPRRLSLGPPSLRRPLLRRLLLRRPSLRHPLLRRPSLRRPSLRRLSLRHPLPCHPRQYLQWMASNHPIPDWFRFHHRRSGNKPRT